MRANVVNVILPKGILGLNLFPILIGTLPVVALIVPTVLCGSLAFMGSLENEDGEDLYPWAGKYFSTCSLYPMLLL